MRTPTSGIIAAGASLLLATGCGGGGNGGGGPPGPAPNTAPAISSPNTATVSENTAGVFYTVNATDAEGGPFTYFISGGDDASLFQINAAGGVSFKSPPNFELPEDRNGDNAYLVTLGVRDPGGLEAQLTVTVSVTDVTTGAFQVRRVSSGFNRPVYLSAIPGSPERVAVVEKGGVVRLMNTTTHAIATAPFLDVSGQVTTDGERGLLSIAFPPDYATSRAAYVFMSNLAGNIEIRRYTAMAGDQNRLDPASGNVIMRIPHSNSNLNYGGWLGFGPFGLLYITVGDGNDCPGPQTTSSIRNCNARRYEPLLGKVLRIDVSADAFPADSDRDYTIPSNRFGTEMLLFGLRNPYRASFDPRENVMWFGDIGQDREEEIDRIRIPLVYPGVNPEGVMDFEWPYKEGTQLRLFDLDFPRGSADTRPRAVYAHGTGPAGGRAVVGGYVYFAGPVESLVGEYIYGDQVTGQVFSYRSGSYSPIPPAETARDRTAEFRPASGTIDNISSFGLDSAGNLYILDLDGEIYVVEPA